MFSSKPVHWEISCSIFSRHVSSDLVPVSERQFYLQLRQPEEAAERCSPRTRQVFVCIVLTARRRLQQATRENKSESLYLQFII